VGPNVQRAGFIFMLSSGMDDEFARIIKIADVLHLMARDL